LNGSGGLGGEVYFASRVVESELRDFDAVVASGQTGKIKLTVLVCPTDKRAPARCVGEEQRSARNSHAAGCVDLPFRLDGYRRRGSGSSLRCGSFLRLQRQANRQCQNGCREHAQPHLCFP